MKKEIDHSKLDFILLCRLLKEIRKEIDHRGQHVLFFVPMTGENIKTCQFVLNRNGIKTEAYFSDMDENLILNIKMRDVEKLNPKAKNFLKMLTGIVSDDYLKMVEKEMDEKPKKEKTGKELKKEKMKKGSKLTREKSGIFDRNKTMKRSDYYR